MDRKPKIEYVGSYYVFGSEARQVETAPKKPKTTLPKIRREKHQKIYVDPMAMLGITVACIMLIVLAIGSVQLYGSIRQYRQMEHYVTELRRENATLQHTYHTAYDLDEVRKTAENAGYLPSAEAEHWIIRVTVPQHSEGPSNIQNLKWFLKLLFSGAKR